ncbi:MAG: c-type cytochrome [Bryobacterales bacterium]|nr:c-type cytochrome [Bryobacterales bacterium]
MPSRLWWTILPGALLVCGACAKRGGEPPYSPAESMARIQLDAGYRIAVFASEPDVVSPVAMDIDEDGRIYVVENPGYPLDVESRVGRIRLLEDTDGDGKPDRATVFAEDLVLPTGVMRWKQGVLVTDAPDVWYFEDSDGDGKADVRRKVLTGFPLTNPQHTVNSPLYGLDNWIYLAHENPTTAVIFADKFGDRGSDIRYADRPKSAISERGRNIRFRPDTGALEALAAPSQFGQQFDDFGRHFVLNNTYHARHAVIEARYLKRNPDLPVATAIEEISAHGTPAKVYPIVAQARFEMLTNIGQFTSACGLTFWLGGAFVAEPAHNLVHRDVYTPDGATFRAAPEKEGTEFLASTDPWFRPVNFYAGPDGALYLLDYYRLTIEHPEWMSTETHTSSILTEGSDLGRIYRIAPAAGAPSKDERPRLSTASAEELAAHLANANPWWRRTAQRLLVDRQAAEAAPLLAEMAASHASPVARVHALWTLEGLKRLDSSLVAKALADPAAGVRENAVRLAESRPELSVNLLAMAAEPDPRVRFQLLCTLGSVQTAEARRVRDRLLAADFGSRWTQIAALGASPEEAPRLLALGVRENAPPSFFRQAASVIGARNRPAEVQAVLAAVTRSSEGWRGEALDGLAAGLRTRSAKLAPPLDTQLLALFDDATVGDAALGVLETTGLRDSAGVRAAAARAERTARDRTADAGQRSGAIRLLALRDPASRRTLFEDYASPAEPEPVQIAAVRALGAIPGPETGRFLIERWRGFTAPVRMQAADSLYQDPDRIPLAVAALQNGDIQPWTLAFRHRSRLIMHRDPQVREIVRPLLEASAGERAAVIARYRESLTEGDASRGKEVFDRVCAKCHRLSGEGADVGPDLATVRHQPKEVLLADILNPSQSISQGFEAYVVETVSGAMYDGVIGSQTATAVTLRQEEGREHVIPRGEIKSMHVTNLSAMPADLEQQIDVRQMGDLLEYIRQGGVLASVGR